MKTFLVALFICVRCTLFPGSKVVICSQTRSQGNETLLKIEKELMGMFPNLAFEIKSCNIGQNKAEIQWKNGSWARVVTSSDTGRGGRANVLCVDEFVKVDPNIITAVLKKFLTAPRHPKFLNKPEYAGYPQERNKEIYMSSAWMKSHWSFAKLKTYVAQLLDDKKKYFCCGLPYQLAIKENLLMREQVEDEMSEQDFNETIWDMEMGCLFFGDTDGAFFSYDDISKRRQLVKAYYGLDSTEKKNKIPMLAVNERRILSVDVALLASRKQKNDAASIFINSALPTKDGRYIGNFIYGENHEGLHTNDLALIIRRLFEQFHCTDIALDVRGLGVGVYDALCRDISDPLLGVVYPPLSCCNDPVYADRCVDANAPKVIWCLQGTLQFNSDMYLSLRGAFQSGYINLLVNEFEAEENFRMSVKGYNKLSASEKAKMLMPYINTTLLVNELIDLDHEVKGSNVRVFEKKGKRKDRVSSLGYNFYVQSQLALKIKKKKDISEIAGTPFCASIIDF